MERWRKVVGFPLYEVSDQGRVRRISSGHIIKPVRGGNRDPRNAVGLYRDGKQYKLHIARLVLTAFVRAPKSGEMALHEHDDLTTDRLERLRWGKHRDNVQDAKINKRYRGPQYWKGKSPSEQTRAKLRAALQGRKRPAEVVAKLGVGSKKHWEDPNYRAEMLALHLGRKRPEAARENMRIAQRARRRREGGEEAT